MSESSAAGTASGRPFDPTALHHSLTWSLMLIFAVGAPALIVTRILYWTAHPEQYATGLPSISGTASEPPSSIFFLWAMIPVIVFLCIGWTLNVIMNTGRLAAVAPRHARYSGAAILTFLSCILGYTAAAFLAVLSFYPLRAAHDIHIAASWGFYLCTAFAILIETGGTAWLHRICAGAIGPLEQLGLRLRGVVATGVLVFSLLFLYLYVARDNALPVDAYTLQAVYVVVEYIVVFLFFAYPVTGFLEMRRHFRVVAPMLGSQ